MYASHCINENDQTDHINEKGKKKMALTAQMEEYKINRIKLATQIEVDEVPCIPKSYLQCLSCLV